jgi:PAS domain S-box-containing protein
MNGKIDDFVRQIETARWRVAGLERHAAEALSTGDELLPPVLQELTVAFEELQVAQEELLHQQSELASTRSRVEAERQRYQELFDFAPDAYLITSANGVIREANRAATALLGMSQTTLVGTPLALFIADYARRAFRRDIKQLGHMAGPQHWQIRMQPHKSPAFEAAITVAPIHDWSGLPSGLRWMLRDVTEHARAEQQIRALNEQLEQRVHARTAELEAAIAEKDAALERARMDRQAAEQGVRDREAFMAVVGHELKAPLAAIIGYGQLLQRRVRAGDTLKGRDLRGLRTIVDSARQLTTMVDLLQDAAQIQTGTLHINRAPCDLCALVRDVTETLRATLKLGTLHIRYAQEQVVVEGDLLRLQQVIQNLLQNAIKYSPDDRKIEIVVERVDHQARLSVSDHGIGIPEAARERIFERFYRAGNAEQNQIGGMGIGLYIVKQIVSLHGGRVEVESQVGSGSTFTVWLPLPMNEAQTSEAAPAPGAG